MSLDKRRYEFIDTESQKIVSEGFDLLSLLVKCEGTTKKEIGKCTELIKSIENLRRNVAQWNKETK